ncbi:unnamed protein product [Amoebophrya sp. A120]|nr:unnamed protein product [Amoebophrya sp. A120]|eukprot:GSA120T00017761001.1
MAPQHTLATLLETPGPGDEVLSFLHGAEVAGLACVSKETRKAVSRKDGKLRCVNLVVRFKCAEEDDGATLVAQRRALGHVFARMDINAVRSLLVEVRTDFTEKTRRVRADQILDQIQSLMGPRLREFGLMVVKSAKLDTDEHEGESIYVDPETAEREPFQHFARSLVSLSQLEVLYLPGSWACHSVDFPSGVDARLPGLKELHITSFFDFHEITSASLVCAVLGQTQTAGNGTASEPLPPPGSSDCCGLAVFSCRALSCQNIKMREALPAVGARLWEKCIAPSLQKLSLRANWDGDDLMEADWFWGCCKAVMHLEVDFLSDDGGENFFGGRNFPALKSLTLADLQYASDNWVRTGLLEVLETLNFSKQQLVFYNATISAVELGSMYARMHWAPPSRKGSASLHNWKLREKLGDIVMGDDDIHSSPITTTTPKITTGPPLCPMLEIEATAHRMKN